MSQLKAKLPTMPLSKTIKQVEYPIILSFNKKWSLKNKNKKTTAVQAHKKNKKKSTQESNKSNPSPYQPKYLLIYEFRKDSKQWPFTKVNMPS